MAWQRLYFHLFAFTPPTVRRRHHIEGGQFPPGYGLGPRTSYLAALVDRNMDAVYASNSPTWVLLQRLSLRSDCYNPGPVICTLQFPSSTSACIFNLLRRPWSDSHLRRELLTLLLIYSSIMAHRLSPHLRDSGRRAKRPHWSLTLTSRWGRFWEGSSHCCWVFLVILYFVVVYFHASTSQRQLFTLFMVTDRFTWQRNARKHSEMGPLFRTSFMWQAFPKVWRKKNGRLGICWNAAFKEKHLRLLHICITAWQTLASDYISILKCVILPTVPVLEKEKASAAGISACCFIQISGPSMSNIPEVWQSHFFSRSSDQRSPLLQQSSPKYANRHLFWRFSAHFHSH